MLKNHEIEYLKKISKKTIRTIKRLEFHVNDAKKINSLLAEAEMLRIGIHKLIAELEISKEDAKKANDACQKMALLLTQMVSNKNTLISPVAISANSDA